MEHYASPHGIALVAELRRLEIDDRPLRRAAHRGDLVRVHRGAYVSAAEWMSLDRHERYRRQVVAAALASRSRPVLSHQSAAAMWGIPIIGPWPTVVHVLTSMRAGTRTENGFRRHAAETSDEDVVELDGVRFTGFERTLIDLARETGFASAVASVDWSLRGSEPRRPKPVTSIDVLREYADHQQTTRNRRKLSRVLDFATPLAESPGESLSRVVIHELGFPAPSLQVPFSDRKGIIGRVDFAWPEFSLVGEFDGLIKYTRGMARPGENVEKIVVREKVREDRIRALGERMTRWLWATARSPGDLYRQLVDAGLPTAGRPR
jgi:predicted transcriptional regulator of viral defense system